MKCGLAAAVLILCALPILRGQSPDGFTVQERPGVALVKPQAWLSNDEAKVMEFQAFTDRTVKSTAGAGYYEFRTAQNPKVQVAASRIVKLIVYPDPNQYPQLVKAEDRELIATEVNEMQSTLSEFPAIRSYLQPSLSKLQADLSRYDGGEVKVDGQWQSRESFLSAQINSLGTQVRGDIIRAKSVNSFDLASDTAYTSLQQLAKNSPGAQAMVTELSQLYAKRQRAEQRQDILDQLDQPSTNYVEARGAVERLRTMQPEEDPKSAAFLKKWDAEVAAMEALNTTAKPLAAALEKELTATSNLIQEPPQLPLDLGTKLAALSGQARLFLAGSPSPVLLVEGRQPIAIYKTMDGFQKMRILFQQKHFLEAKDIVDPLVSKSAFVGPQTARVVVALQSYVISQIEQFTKIREEANLLLDSGKQAEALAKFQAAYEIIPDSTVGDEITMLKKSLQPPPANN